MTDTRPVLSVQDLSIRLRHNGAALVQGVHLQLQRGEIHALVGESGSGKSLTALAIMRLLPEALEVSGGRLHLGQTDVFALPESAMNGLRGKRMAMIFQEPQTSLNPVQSIGEQIAEVLRLHRPATEQACQQQVMDLLQEVGIPDPAQRLHWYPHQMSGGQKQRVMIAMALAAEPELLIADEPTTALDVTIQKQILELLKALCQKRQLAILLITHDMGVVAALADTVSVMQQGRVLEQQATNDFFKAPQQAYSRQLLRALQQDGAAAVPAQAEPLLAVQDLRIWFPRRSGLLQRVVDHTRAVEGVSFEIPRASTLALVGESGCGKTTIGKALLRLLPTHSGSILWHGPDENGDGHPQALQQLSAQQFLPYRRRIQMIFQDPFSSMNPRLTVREIIEEGMVHLCPEWDALQRRLRLETLVEKVGLLQEHLQRYPHEFSGGQRQRIAIARALAVQPQLIICDEPTSALDVSIREQVLALLKKIQQEEGVSYLFITHDLSLVPHISHRVAVMQYGLMVEQGSVEQVMQHPQQAYTRQLLAAAPKLPGGIP